MHLIRSSVHSVRSNWKHFYSFAKYGEDLKLDETEEYKSVMENARKDILARLAMKQLFDSVKVTDEEVKDYYEANKSPV